MSDFATIEQAVADIRAGRMLVVIDDEDVNLGGCLAHAPGNEREVFQLVVGRDDDESLHCSPWLLIIRWCFRLCAEGTYRARGLPDPVVSCQSASALRAARSAAIALSQPKTIVRYSTTLP